jgi:glycosyltransferase involved in cell wall biosynthesis
MQKKINILIHAGMKDKQIYRKLLPISEINIINSLILMRKNKLISKYRVNSLKEINPMTFFRFPLLFELYSIIKSLWLILVNKVDCMMAIYFFPRGLIVFFVSIFFKVKVIQNIVGADLFKIIDNKFYLRILKKSDIIITRGEISKNMLVQQGIKKQNIYIIPNVYYFKEYKNEKKVYDFIYIGSFVKKKRIYDIIEALRILKIDNIDFSILFLGNGPLYNQVNIQVKKNNLEENCTFIGYVDNVEDYILKSRSLVLTSENEGLPMVLVEAMSFGLPCIVTNSGDVTTIAKHNYNSLVSEIGDVESIANNMKLLLNDSNLYRRLSNNSFSIRKKNKEYSKENISLIWDDIFKIFS